MFKRLILVIVLSLISASIMAEDVDTAWVSRYNGLGDSEDHALDMAVDNQGNIIVTGYSNRNNSYPHDPDYVTIKYLPNGDTAWVRIYNGPTNDGDAAKALAVDDSNYIYVTGVSYSSDSRDYATVKYAPEGDTVWVRRWNMSEDASDEAYDVTADNFGNAYVTGTGIGTETNLTDIVTIKYLSNGDTAWVRQYDGPDQDYDVPFVIAVDQVGNVYVAGRTTSSETSTDFLVIKYDNDGNELWARTYNGADSLAEELRDMVVDGSGNAYVTGYYYKSDGKRDIITVKFQPDGDTAWVRTFNNIDDGNDESEAMALDDLGNVYVTGWSYLSGTGSDCVLIKYSTAGDSIWTAFYHGPYYGGSDKASDIALDNAGNIYLGGYGMATAGNPDYLAVKFNPEGELVWAEFYGKTAIYLDYGEAIAVDGDGHTYITGWSQDEDAEYDYATVKFHTCYDSDNDGYGDPGYPENECPTDNCPFAYNPLQEDYDLDGLGDSCDPCNNFMFELTIIDTLPVTVTEPVTYYPAVSDPDDTEFTITYEIIPFWASIQNDTLTGIPPGDTVVYFDTVSFTIMDACNVDSMTFVTMAFLCGNLNGDDKLNILDITYLIAYLYQNGPEPMPLIAADVNDDGLINILDISYLIAYLYMDGPPPVCQE